MLKYSRQRESIKNFLDNNRIHPTAETVYLSIKKDFPNISLATVYRNLNLLADQGEILRISTGDGAVRFDGNPNPHYHFICKSCGSVLDIPLDPQKQLNDLAGKQFEGLITGHVTHFFGLCPECYKRQTQ